MEARGRADHDRPAFRGVLERVLADRAAHASTSEVLEIPCLGLPFQLGMLYDSRKSQIVPGVKLWDENVLRDEKYLNIRPHISSSSDIISEDSISEKTSHLDIEAGLKMSLLGGMLDVSGSANFVHDKKSSKRQSRVSLWYKYTDRFEELTMEQMKEVKFTQSIDNDVATHVVTGVEYGARAFFVFDGKVAHNESHNEVHGSMKAEIIDTFATSAIAGGGGHASINVSRCKTAHVDNFFCKFYGDVQLELIPTNFEEAKKAYKELPTLVAKKDEQGRPLTVPMSVSLYPLSLLDSKAARLVQEVGDELISKAEDIMENLDELEMQTKDLCMEVCEKFPGIGEQLSTFSENITTYRDDLKSNLKLLLPQIRRGKEEKKQELVTTLRVSSQHLQRLSCQLKQKQEEVEVLTTYLDGMGDIHHASSDGELFAAFNNVKYKYLLHFAISISGKDPGIPWYRDPSLISDVRHKAKQFTDFARANKGKGDLLCLTANCSDSDGNSAAAITLYEDGKPNEFEPPSQPGKPKASSITLDNIQLEWAKPQYGSQNVSYYTISYRPHSDPPEPWKTQKTEGVQEAATVTGLARATVYDFKINAVCDVGTSADSEVNDCIETPFSVLIVPHKEANGIDICGTTTYQHIIRSDLGYYMKTIHVRDDYHQAMHSLHPACSGGDHYLATSGYTYIIKGDSCHRITDMSTNANATTFTLHKNCTRGNFYMATNSDNFYIIFDDGRFLKHVEDLEEDPGDEKQPLHPNCMGGLYYWATRGYFYFLKPVDKWGLEYHRTRDLTDDRDGVDFSVHPTVTKFLPGGLAITMGHTFGEWQQIKVIDNKHGTVDMRWSQTVTKRVGYKKDALHSVQHNSSALSTEEGADIIIASFKKQFFLSLAYGGQVINTTNEDWSEEHDVEESIDITIPSGKSVYIWQYKVGMRKEGEPAKDVLYTQHLKQTDTPNQPIDVPLHMTTA